MGESVLAPTPAASAALLRLLSQLGHVLLSSGEVVRLVEDTVQRIAVAHDARRISIVAFPTALFVQFEDDSGMHLEFTSHKGVDLRFDQIEEIFALANDAAHADFAPEEGLRRLAVILGRRPVLPLATKVGGHMLASAGIALLLQPTAGAVAAAAGLGLMVGALKLFAANRGMLSNLLPTTAAFLVATVALAATHYGFIASSPLNVLLAALVTLLPGGALAVATMELAYGGMVSGAVRFVAGLLQLAFLILGMVMAASLVGVPPDRLLVQGAQTSLGPWAGWAGVVLFGFGHVLHYSARLRTLPWVFLVLTIAQTGHLLGTAAFGGYMGGFVGALVVTPTVYLIQYQLGGPPAITNFLPALWLLVPGALGATGLAGLVAEDHLAGLQDFVTALFSIVAIAFGALFGAGLYDQLVEPIFRRGGAVLAQPWVFSWPRRGK